MRITRPACILALVMHFPTELHATRVQLVELYQSQGCSSCPPANAALNAIADREDIIALSFAVTYWDQLGWTDRFAKPVFTARQRAYASSMGADTVYTPQMIINGQKAFVGSRKGELEAMLNSAPKLPGTRLNIADGKVQASIGPRPAEIWLVSYDPRVQQVAIKAGENSGRTLPHRNIVTGLQLLGNVGAKPMNIPSAATGQSRVLLLQEPNGGAVLDAVKL